MKKPIGSRISLTLAVLAIAGTVAMAAPGNLSFPEKSSSPPQIRSWSSVMVSKKPVTDFKGLMSKNAVVGTRQGTGIPMMVAVDASKEGGQLDTLKLDFSGKGDFSGATAIPMTITTKGKTSRGNLKPQVVEVPLNGEKVPVWMGFYFYVSGTRKYISCSQYAAMEGTCLFGDSDLKVTVEDNTSNLKFDDAPKPPFRSTRIVADSVKITSGKETIQAHIGQPVLVAGKWYVPEVSGRKIKATPFTGSVGSIEVPASSWKCTLVGKKYFLEASGSDKPVAVPCDEYNIARYQAKIDGKEGGTIYGAKRSIAPGAKGAVTVKSGDATKLPLTGPITARVATRKTGKKVSFSLYSTDAVGSSAVSILGADNKRRPAPSIDVIDSAGKKVYTAKLRYG